MRGRTLALAFILIAHRRGDVDGDFAGGEKCLHDEGSDRGDECAHHRPFGVLGLSALDLPRRRDNHRESPEVRDVGENAHAAADGGIEAGRLSENVGAGENGAAAMEKVSSSEKVRVHGDYCTTTRQKHGKGYVGALLKFLRRYIGTAIFRANFGPKNGPKRPVGIERLGRSN